MKEVKAISANLGPLYLAAEEYYRQAATDEEKLAALEKMLSTIPKHKATEKMQASIKKRMAKLRASMKSSKGPRRKDLYRIEKHGAGQIAMAGPPNSGKSQILKAMTRATPEVAPYPFTTREPLQGMAQWENVQIQLVDLPPLAPETSQPWLWGILRSADALLVVVDIGDDDVLEHLENMVGFMEENNIKIKNNPKRGFNEKKALCAATKCDLPGAEDRLELLVELLGDDMSVHPCSGLTGQGLDALCPKIFFDLLGKIRVYTRPPGKKPDYRQPFILDRGTTVLGAAEAVHKEIAENLRYARVWGKNVFEGQQVPRDHVLSDGDVIVLYA